MKIEIERLRYKSDKWDEILVAKRGVVDKKLKMWEAVN